MQEGTGYCGRWLTDKIPPTVSTARIDLARYKRLAVRSADTWQGGLFRLPMWIQENEDAAPYRPTGAFWRSVSTGLIWCLVEPQPRTANADLALRALLEFGQKHEDALMGRPARIEVPNARFADELRHLLDDRDTTVAVIENLPDVDDALRQFAEYESGPLPRGLMDTPGVTPEHVRRFAAAAAGFYGAEPWEALEPGDLIAIDLPGLDVEMRHLVVTGSTRDSRGVMFFTAQGQFERFMSQPPTSGRKPRMWMIAFDRIDSLPFADVDAWEDLQLPVTADDAYPRPGLTLPDGLLGRPNPTQLAHLEAILRALATTTDDEFDSGEWTKPVDTVEGPMAVRLSLPRLLQQMARESETGAIVDEDPNHVPQMRFAMEQTLRRALRAGRSADTPEEATRLIEEAMAAEAGGGHPPKPSEVSPEEHALAIAQAAMATTGRRKIQLARRALAICPDCADAWSALGSRAIDLQRAVRCYRQAVAAGERAIGPDGFAASAGHFWEAVDTRPYMRARMALADCIDATGDIAGAADHYREMLRLNPGDNQGARHRLFDCLLTLRCDADAQALVEQFKEDESPDWQYAAALVAFRRDGDSVGARALRADAVGALPLAVPYLTGERELPTPPTMYRPYSRDHAIVCADWMADLWGETPGACEWLAAGSKPKGRRRR